MQMRHRAMLVSCSVICCCVVLGDPVRGTGAVREPVAVARVGYIRADWQPQVTPCAAWDPATEVAWDYGNRSIVIDLGTPRWVTSVVVVSDQESPHGIKIREDTVRLYHSRDNKGYTRYGKPFTLDVARSQEPGEVWRVEWADFGIYTRFIKLKQTFNGAECGFVCSNLAQSAQVFTDGSGIGAVAISGLNALPAQPEGSLEAYVRVGAAATPAMSLALEARHTETMDTVRLSPDFAPGQWVRVGLEDDGLRPGGWRVTARLTYKGQLLAERSTCTRLYAHDAAALKLVSASGEAEAVASAVVLPPDAGSGARPFAYALGHSPDEVRTGLELAKGERLTLNPSVSGVGAVYIAVGNPWPEIRVGWGEWRQSSPRTQLDWEPDSTVQELFVGVGELPSAPLVIEAVGGSLRVFYARFIALSADESTLARYEPNPAANRRVIYNNDGYSELWGKKSWDKSRLLQLVERYQGTDTELFEMAAWVSGAVNFPSKYATFWDQDDPLLASEWLRENDRMAVALFNQLEDDGIPIFPTLIERGRELGIPVWGSLRMSAYYPIREHQTMQPFNGRLWHEHPEMRIRGRSGNRQCRMSYAWEAVRCERIGVLAEMAEMGCEGVMMDFCRYPYILGCDEPLVQGFMARYGVSPLELDDADERWLGYRCEVMNGFFRAVRRRIDEIGAAQGRRIRVSVRVPATGCRELGFDPETWAREKLMDIFIPHYPGLEKDFDVEPWVRMARGTGILVYPGMTPTKTMTSTTELTDAQVKAGIKPGSVTSMSRNDYRRKAWRRYRAGADGVYLFNVWTIGITRNLLGDKRALERWSYFEDPMNLPRLDVVFPAAK